MIYQTALTRSVWIKKIRELNKLAYFLVGVTGLEPAASWSRTKRATKLRYTPSLFFAMLFYILFLVLASVLLYFYLFCGIILKKRFIFERSLRCFSLKRSGFYVGYVCSR